MTLAGDKSDRESDLTWIAPTFDRVFRGYDPAAVDRHLADVIERVSQLLERSGPVGSPDLIRRATKRSVDEALRDARARADSIVAEAEARIRELDTRHHDRKAELERLIATKTSELQTLEQQIKARQESLRATAADLRRLATGLSGHEEGPNPEGAGFAIAAMKDDGIEIVLSAESVSGS
jgi:DivIVA domain-containing protein